MFIPKMYLMYPNLAHLMYVCIPPWVGYYRIMFCFCQILISLHSRCPLEFVPFQLMTGLEIIVENAKGHVELLDKKNI